ncbi:MAG TPA: heme-binding protein [Verrucomicrobiales bacterium]|nr:heme-binding protein [Verrucomicrobiales bacterium]
MFSLCVRFVRRLAPAAAFIVAAKTGAAAARPAHVLPDAPPVQMLVPGFVVRELPLELRNLNNFVYAPDGRLFALGYDGNVHQFADSDGDGLEDRATLFWDNTRNEIPPSIGMAWGPGGLYIASRGRIIHLRDRGDGTSELLTVTGGWLPPTAAAGSNLDAIGLAVDRNGQIYFGLGVDAWNGAYRVDKDTGVSRYNPFSERGTIIRLSPDWKRRDIIATGLRFPVSLAFNAAGDLFCSDQEGATWLPNGNPFDELLHIQSGRHYGFPPRHPRHLPGVIDEPSVFDYGPQHQSTCGVHFNEPKAGGNRIFGPAWWKGDAFVAGESRGKIWRTKLVSTPAGYVAKNDLIACLALLTIDAVPTPQGDLLVACHSGAPDWGTGPQGIGRVFTISYRDDSSPQPVLAYAASPTETRIVFDRPVDPARWRTAAKQSRVTTGRYVAAGDRFETLTPGYQVVKDQANAPRTEVPVVSAALGADLHSLVLRTRSRTEAAGYAVSLPDGTEARRAHSDARRELPQHAAIDLLTDLTGVEAEWRDAAGRVRWSGWLPHLDLQVARELTAASPEHRGLFELLRENGTLQLRTQLDLNLMLRPAIQPGAKLDHAYAPERVTIRFQSAGAFEVRPREPMTVSWRDRKSAELTIDTGSGGWWPVEVSLATGQGDSPFAVVWHTAEDTRSRPLPLRRLLLPWATARAPEAAGTGRRDIPEIAGGDWERGRRVFFGPKAACSACHQVRGEGGVIGPDLSNLVHRDYASVLQDIVNPSAAINPDRLAYTFELRSGPAVHGLLLDETPTEYLIGDATGATRPIPKAEVTSTQASAQSLMPTGLWEGLSEGERRDLMRYLIWEMSENEKHE